MAPYKFWGYFFKSPVAGVRELLRSLVLNLIESISLSSVVLSGFSMLGRENCLVPTCFHSVLCCWNVTGLGLQSQLDRPI